MQKAAKLDPRSAVIGIKLGQIYRNKRLHKLAESQYKKVIELHPDFGLGYSYLAGLYRNDMGQFDKALLLSKKASALDPEFHFDNLNQVYTYLNLGDLEAAQEVRDKMAGSGAEEWMLRWVDVHISFIKGNPAGTREAINWLLQKNRNIPGGLPQWLGTIALAQGDIQRSREIYLSDEPGWLEPDQWPALIDDRNSDLSCRVAWLFMNTGDQEPGAALLQQTTAYIEDTLPLVTEHSDLHFPDTCYLTAGDTEKALLSIETQLAHNHLAHWGLIHQMPMYDLIRHEPRYQAAWAERERRISVQRENIEKMAAETQP